MSDTNKPQQSFGAGASIGLNMAVGISVFTFLGYKIDQWQGTDNLFTLIGVFLGLLYCGYEIWKLIRQINKES